MKAVIRNKNEGINFLTRACSGLGEKFENPQLIEVKRYKPPRSLPQNAKFHVMLGELANEIGYSLDDLKDYFKWEFGPKQCISIGGKDRMIPRSTASYSKMEMVEMIGQVERVGAENGFQFSEVTNGTS